MWEPKFSTPSIDRSSLLAAMVMRFMAATPRLESPESPSLSSLLLVTD
jgi:hypothetical protein